MIRLVALVGVVAVGLAGCMAGPGEPEPVPVPRDRDEAAVLATLRSLDPCALLDPGAAGTGALPASLKPVYGGPHGCQLRNADDSAGVYVTVGSPFTPEERLGNVADTVAGATVYSTRVLKPDDGCDLHVPVSFRYSVRFTAWNANGSHAIDECAVARKLAADAIPQLREPATVTAEPGLPLAEWDVCAVFRDALDTAAPDVETDHAVGFDAFAGLDGCGAVPSAGGDPDVSLRLSYQPPPSTGDGVAKTLAGQEVFETDYGDLGCTVDWSDGPARTGGVHRVEHQVVQVVGRNCAEGEAITSAVLTTMSGAPPRADRWTKPLPYRPDEPDQPAAGACAYYTTDPHACQPYRQVEVPPELVAAAEHDGNVTCRLALDAVRTWLGEEPTPVVEPDPARCLFVTRTGTVWLALTITSDPVAPPSGEKVDRLDVLGHPGWLLVDGDSRRGELALHREGPGTLTFDLVLGPEPGQEDGARVDTAPAGKLVPLLGHLLSQNLLW
jgi:hypothetical protein